MTNPRTNASEVVSPSKKAQTVVNYRQSTIRTKQCSLLPLGARKDRGTLRRSHISIVRSVVDARQSLNAVKQQSLVLKPKDKLLIIETRRRLNKLILRRNSTSSEPQENMDTRTKLSPELKASGKNLTTQEPNSKESKGCPVRSNTPPKTYSTHCRIIRSTDRTTDRMLTEGSQENIVGNILLNMMEGPNVAKKSHKEDSVSCVEATELLQGTTEQMWAAKTTSNRRNLWRRFQNWARERKQPVTASTAVLFVSPIPDVNFLFIFFF